MTRIRSVPGSAWDRTAGEPLPRVGRPGRAWQTARAQAEPGHEMKFGAGGIDDQNTLGPRLCLGPHRRRGSASRRAARQSLADSACPGRAWARDEIDHCKLKIEIRGVRLTFSMVNFQFAIALECRCFP